ncbi:MAG: GTP-binding protein [Candidatus Lokiarchaeota archaeon]|nr:GTP-binding protein [Candidatus Lokiarchaeota archaeon]
MSQLKKFVFKIVVVGDGGIGKSTMIQRLITGRFIEQKITIGTDLASWSINLDDLAIRLQIWDFAGEKRFRFFLPNYSRGADGCLLCYDITRYTSFQNLQEWYDIIKENTSNPGYVLVGGKVDLADSRRTVQLEEAEEFQNEYNIPYHFETSSKSGYKTNEIFETLTRLILKKRNLI